MTPSHRFENLNPHNVADSTSASLSEAYEAPYCKPRADLGAYLTIVVALAAYAGIAWLAGWF